MATFPTAHDALQVLAGVLSTQIAANYGATFAPYGGADVVLEDSEATRAERVGVPCVVLSVLSDRQSGLFPLWSARDAVIRADVEANDFSGAQIGAANPEGSDSKLSRALSQIVAAQYDALRDAGLLASHYESESERVAQSIDEPDLHIKPARITFSYLVTE